MDLKAIRKNAMFILGIVTVGAMSVPAFAETSDYRRGYERGYRDGVEADRRNDRRASMGRIDIESARYGINNNTCDAEDALQRAANRSQNRNDWRRRTFSIAVNNELCGDPAPRRVKTIDVRYRCGVGPMLRVQVQEGQTLNLNCQRVVSSR